MTEVSWRWPDGVANGFVAIPVALLRHAKALKLDDHDLRLLAAMEAFRWDGDGMDPVWPSMPTLAELCGCSVSQVERRVAKLKRLDLIEVERRGRYGSNRYTREGLDSALLRRVWAEDDPAPMREQGGDDPAPMREQGRDVPASMRHVPAPMRGGLPAPMRGEVEEVETEKEIEGPHVPASMRGDRLERRSGTCRAPDCERRSELQDGYCPPCYVEQVVWPADEAAAS